MRLTADLALALRLLARDWRAGELTLVAVAVVVAVASVTTVGFFADRVQQALTRQANQLLGADLVISGDRPLDRDYAGEAAKRSLTVARMLRFPSMASGGGQNVLAEIKVVTAGYPLRGDLRIADQLHGTDRKATEIPQPGTVWVDERLLSRLGVAVGDRITIGVSQLPIAQVITQEPDSAIGFINAGPRVLLNDADIAATGLIQVGSRVRYRLLVSGEPREIASYRAWVTPKLGAGQRVGNRGQPRLVVVTQRQVQHQIEFARNAELGEFVGHRLAQS